MVSFVVPAPGCQLSPVTRPCLSRCVFVGRGGGREEAGAGAGEGDDYSSTRHLMSKRAMKKRQAEIYRNLRKPAVGKPKLV